jgi:hypothetical protein
MEIDNYNELEIGKYKGFVPVVEGIVGSVQQILQYKAVLIIVHSYFCLMFRFFVSSSEVS